jgi:predicted amidohydrolase YtcJ
LEELQNDGLVDVDRTFSDKILLPGFVEAHSHLSEGGRWNFAYVGYFDRRGPDGAVVKGLKTKNDVVRRLQDTEALFTDPARPLLGWGLDPIYFDSDRLTTTDLDRVSGSRPIAILHASGHMLNVNGAMLRKVGITDETPIEGIVRDEEGRITGELREFAAMFIVFRAIDNAFVVAGQTEEAIWNFGKVAHAAGVTTATDLYNDLSDDTVQNLLNVTGNSEFPLRIVPSFSPTHAAGSDGLGRLQSVIRKNTDKLRFGSVKITLDGSIQGFTARLRPPGYLNGEANGIWQFPPQQLTEMVATYHCKGYQVHIHANGDQAIDVALDAIEKVLGQHPRDDHRHSLQHCQLADATQFRRMAALGVSANLFSNHIYYWGDVHCRHTLGLERAMAINAARTAERLDVHFTIHSDAPVTPIGPLFTAWCAVNRRTASGRVLGESERISLPAALHAITLGAAYTLKLDHEIGSIEPGKLADFAVLDANPFEIPPLDLKDINVWGTVVGGRIFPIG